MMRFWHSLYDLLKVPLEVIFIGITMMGIGNLVLNNAFSSLYVITQPAVIRIAEILQRTGMFLVINFPFLLMIRIVTKKTGFGTTTLSAVTGYISFLAATMATDNSSLPSYAFSSVLGMSMTRAMQYTSQSETVYPLQTGVIGVLITALITLWCFSRSRKRNEHSMVSFLSDSAWCVLTSSLLCMAAGTAVSFAWPFLYAGVERIVSFISADTANPVNLALYGITERILGVLNLGALIRTPFWFSSAGGSWVSLSGSSVAGDVTVWTAQYASGAVSGMTGRFITPYYILNIFAVPALLWSVYTVQTDREKKRRMFLLYAAATVISMFSGILLPLELFLLVLSPFLFFLHVGFTGLLFALLQGMQLYLGFNSTSSATMTALPGTLMEALAYAADPSIRPVLLGLLPVGAVFSVLYFAAGRYYFRHMAIDLFRTGYGTETVREVVAAAGGAENIRQVTSSLCTVNLSLLSPAELQRERLYQAGAVKIAENGTRIQVSFGAASTMIRRGIEKEIRDTVRSVGK